MNRLIGISISFFTIVFEFALSQTTQVKDTSKIYILPGAEYLTNFGDEIDNVKLAGNARFMHDSVFMNCDTAYIYNKTRSVDAIGNVVINQGDSLFLYGDTLNYYGQVKMAYVYGNVRLIENDLTLTCDSIIYDLNTNVARYLTGGKVVSKKNQNTLTSVRGHYYSDYKKLSFRDSVVLTNPDYIMNSDTLEYFEETEIAYFYGNTTIKGEDNFIFCRDGWYDTQNDIAKFSDSAYLISDKHKLEGDSLYYDGNLSYGKAIKDVRITDTSNDLVVTGQFAEHFEKTNLSKVTGNPIVSRWFEEDTLFLTGDTIKVFNDSANEKNIVYAFNNVKFYKSDIQGDCDSMVYNQADSILSMFSIPIIWSDESQLFGDTIFVQLANNRVKEINLINNSLIIEEITDTFKVVNDTSLVFDSVNNRYDTVIVDKNFYENFYNQIKGKTIKGIFTEDTIRKVFVDGNGQSIYFTGDENKPTQAMNKILCSNIIMTFANNKVSDILFLKKPEGTLFPIQDITKNEMKLEGFKWEIEKRPISKKDLISPKFKVNSLDEPKTK